MSDLKPIWSDPPLGNVSDLGGDLPTATGGDPLIDTGGNSGLQPVWSDPFVSTPGGKETANSVSGLPLHPDRYQPSEQPPAPPDLTDRSPGTIDKR